MTSLLTIPSLEKNIISLLTNASTTTSLGTASQDVTQALADLGTLEGLVPAPQASTLKSIISQLQAGLSTLDPSNLKVYQQTLKGFLSFVVPPPVALTQIPLSNGLPVTIQSNGYYLQFCLNCALPGTPTPHISSYACQGYNSSFVRPGSGELPISFLWFLQPLTNGAYAIYNLGSKRYLRGCSACVGKTNKNIFYETCCDSTTTDDPYAQWYIITNNNHWTIKNIGSRLYLSPCDQCLQVAAVRTSAISTNQPVLQSTPAIFVINPLYPSPSGLKSQSGAIALLQNVAISSVLSSCHNCSNPISCNGNNVIYRPAGLTDASVWFILPMGGSLYNIFNLFTGNLLISCQDCVPTKAPVSWELCNNAPLSQRNNSEALWNIKTTGKGTFTISNSKSLLSIGYCQQCLNMAANILPLQPIEVSGNTGIDFIFDVISPSS